MKGETFNADVYKKLICDMVWGLSDPKFLRQIYSIITREYKKDRA